MQTLKWSKPDTTFCWLFYTPVNSSAILYLSSRTGVFLSRRDQCKNRHSTGVESLSIDYLIKFDWYVHLPCGINHRAHESHQNGKPINTLCMFFNAGENNACSCVEAAAHLKLLSPSPPCHILPEHELGASRCFSRCVGCWRRDRRRCGSIFISLWVE